MRKVLVIVLVSFLYAGCKSPVQDKPFVDSSAWNTSKYFKTATVESIRRYLRAGADVDARDIVDNTPLHRAALLNKNPKVTKALLNAGAYVNAQGEDGSTPLHNAAEWNENPEVIKVLLDADADPKAKGNFEQTAWDLIQAG